MNRSTAIIIEVIWILCGIFVFTSHLIKSKKFRKLMKSTTYHFGANDFIILFDNDAVDIIMLFFVAFLIIGFFLQITLIPTIIGF